MNNVFWWVRFPWKDEPLQKAKELGGLLTHIDIQVGNDEIRLTWKFENPKQGDAFYTWMSAYNAAKRKETDDETRTTCND